MMTLRRPNRTAHRLIPRLSALGVALGLMACSETGTTGIEQTGDTGLIGGTAEFSPIPLSQATGELAQTGLRLEVRVRPGGPPLVATEVGLAHPNMSGEPEQVDANVTGFDVTGDAGSVSTDLGLAVSFDALTAFNDAAGDPLTLDQVAAAVDEALKAGRHLHVEARREPPAAPQGPNDGAFLASGIRLGGSSDQLTLRVNVGKDNLELNDQPPPDAFLKLLGLTVELRISEGITRIGFRRDPVGKKVEFEGRVSAVDVGRGTFELASGVEVRTTDQTIIDPHGLPSLAAVAEALEGGAQIKAEGYADVTSVDPRVLTALRVRFERHRPIGEFRDGVKSVDLERQQVTLAGGSVLCLGDQSIINPEGDLVSLMQVARALAAGRVVGAFGTATPSPEVGCRALILRVTFVLRPPPMIEFRDRVKAADPDAGLLTLASGVVLCIDGETVVDPEGDLPDLAAVAAALDAGTPVGAVGVAIPGANDSGCRARVAKVRFVVPPPPTFEFREAVAAVDPDAGTITLSNQAVLCVTAETVVSPEGDLTSLKAVAEALDQGHAVVAGFLVTPAPNLAGCRAIVLRVIFKLRPPPPVEFHADVAAVDATAGTISLDNGATLCFDEHSIIAQGHGVDSLADLAEALRDGKVAHADGYVTPGGTAAACRATVVKVEFTLAD